MELVRKVDKKFWDRKKVFITGHTGFKGSWMSLWLKKLGAEVKGYSLKPVLRNNIFDQTNLKNEIHSDIGDIRNYEMLKNSICSFNPEIIIHMAAQPLVIESYNDPINTYSTNVMGTLNLLNICRDVESIKSILVITTDKVYKNLNIDYSYKETDRLGGYDPYSSSKAACEILVSSFRKSFFDNNSLPNVGSVRAGNVIGGGDWSDNRLFPDIIRANFENKNLKIRNPNSTRPWQHVLEPLCGYLLLIENMHIDSNFSDSWNFGPLESDCKSVEWILKYLKQTSLKKLDWEFCSNELIHESKELKLDISKSKNLINWKPKFCLEDAIDLTIDWYEKFYKNEKMKSVCINQIEFYESR
jgi:CDP-glucose 4,6-dehydratase